MNEKSALSSISSQMVNSLQGLLYITFCWVASWALIIGYMCTWGGLLPYRSLMGMCRWMGSHFHNCSDYNGVANFRILGVNRESKWDDSRLKRSESRLLNLTISLHWPHYIPFLKPQLKYRLAQDHVARAFRAYVLLLLLDSFHSDAFLFLFTVLFYLQSVVDQKFQTEIMRLQCLHFPNSDSPETSPNRDGNQTAIRLQIMKISINLIYLHSYQRSDREGRSGVLAQMRRLNFL